MTREALKGAIHLLLPTLKLREVYDVTDNAREFLIEDVGILSVNTIISEFSNYENFALSETHLFLF